MTWQGAANRAIARATGLKLVRVNAPEAAAAQGAEKPAPESRPAAKRAAKKSAKKTAGQRKTTQIPIATTSEIRPPADPEHDRLVASPVFVLAPVRSGSTLLRLMLNAHPRVHSPHELHLRRLRVSMVNDMCRQAMDLLGHDEADLEHLLWDRVLHRELLRSGKDIVVDKTPSNVFLHKRIATAWPQARFVFLIRHPASIAASWIEASAGRRTPDEAIDDCLNYMKGAQRAREALPGLTVRYEELTSEPEKVTREICDFLDVPWEPQMLEYGDRETFIKGVGDWTDKVRSGRVQQGRPVVPDSEIPEQLREMCRTWGYLTQTATDEEVAASRDA